MEIEHSRYILLPSPLSLCLLYHNAEDGQYAQFSVEVEVTKQGEIITVDIIVIFFTNEAAAGIL